MQRRACDRQTSRTRHALFQRQYVARDNLHTTFPQNLWGSFMSEVQQLAASHPYTQRPTAGQMGRWGACFCVGAVLGVFCADPDAGDYAAWESQAHQLVSRYNPAFAAAGCTLNLSRTRHVWSGSLRGWEGVCLRFRVHTRLPKSCLESGGWHLWEERISLGCWLVWLPCLNHLHPLNALSIPLTSGITFWRSMWIRTLLLGSPSSLPTELACVTIVPAPFDACLCLHTSVNLVY